MAAAGVPGAVRRPGRRRARRVRTARPRFLLHRLRVAFEGIEQVKAVRCVLAVLDRRLEVLATLAQSVTVLRGYAAESRPAGHPSRVARSSFSLPALRAGR